MYLGNQPALSYTSFAKQDFTTSATTSYTLDNPVANANELALFINFVRQEPTTAYSASGTSLTLTSATSASDDMYCVFLGKAVQTVNPPSGSVGASQIVDSSIALGKLSATGTKDATTFLRGDNTFASAGGDNTPFTTVKKTNDQTISHGTDTLITFDNVVNESSSNVFDLTNNRFTVPSGQAGTYLILPQLRFYDSNNRLERAQLNMRLNGSFRKSFIYFDYGYSSSNSREISLGSGYLETLSVSDYIDMYAFVATNDSGTLVAESDNLGTTLGIMKLIT